MNLYSILYNCFYLSEYILFIYAGYTYHKTRYFPLLHKVQSLKNNTALSLSIRRTTGGSNDMWVQFINILGRHHHLIHKSIIVYINPFLGFVFDVVYKSMSIRVNQKQKLNFVFKVTVAERIVMRWNTHVQSILDELTKKMIDQKENHIYSWHYSLYLLLSQQL